MSTELRPSKSQRELLSFIEGFVKGNGYGPSYREIMRALNYKSVSTVATHVDNLIKKGHLNKRDRSARSLEVVASEAEYKSKPTVTATESKWLVDQVTTRFTKAEEDADLSKTELDNLYVLVGSLQVLGLDDAARSFKSRLMALVKK